jgi:hypothetical protein
MTIIKKEAKNQVGIEEITYAPGDFRESAGYNITFFRNDHKYHDPSGRKPLTLVKGGMPSFLPTDKLIIH